MMDIVERLREYETIECLKDKTQTYECQILRQQLADMERTWLSPETYATLMQERQETLKQLAKCELERDELVAALEWYRDNAYYPQQAERAKHALTKLGADKE